MAGLWGAVLSVGKAGVYLTSYSFAADSLPQIYTDEALPTPYRLRAKFAGDYHAVSGWNNNWQTLESVPGIGWTTVELYWLKFASDGTTLLEIGPYYQYSVYISAPRSSQTVSSQSAETWGNQPFTPTYSGGAGTGAWQFVVSGYTNWGGTEPGTLLWPGNIPSTSWVPPGPGVYTFYVRKLGDANYYESNYPGPYTVTVNAVTWNWGDTPTSVASGVSYNVNVGVGAGGMPYVTLLKNGSYFAGSWVGTQGTTTDTGAQTVNYSASFSNYTGNTGSSSRQVSIYIPTYTLTTNVVPAGAGNVSGGGTYTGGSTATVSVAANSGYTFTGWSGVLSGSANPATVYMNANYSLTANFVGVPAAPTATGATGASASGYNANWNGVSGATGYRLDVSTNDSFSSFVSGYQDLNVGGATSCTISGVVAGSTYYYRVRAVNTAGVSGNSNTVTLTAVPAAPVASNAWGISSTSLTSNWSTVNGAISYRLDVGTDLSFSNYLPGFYDLNVGSATNYAVSGLSPQVTYYYRVRAVNAGGTSPNSNVITASTITGPPIGLKLHRP